MIITCETCLKRYVISPDSLGAKGRIVKCSSCAHTWYQNPPQDMPKLLDADIPFAPSYSQSSLDPLLSQEPITGFSGSSSFLETQQEFKKLPEKTSSSIIKTFFFFIGISALCAFLYFGRFYISHHLPLFEKLYAMFNLQTDTLTQNIALKEVSWSVGQDAQGNSIFLLKGQIQNISTAAETIPPLSIVFVKENPQGGMCLEKNCIIDRWIAYTSADKILPGENYTFQITLPKSIPSNASNLYIEFVKP